MSDIEEITQMLESDDPGITKGDLESACWYLIGELEQCKTVARLYLDALGRQREAAAKAWDEGFEDYGRYLGTGVVPNNRYRKE